MYLSSITANYDFKPSNWMIFLVMTLVFINAMNASAQDMNASQVDYIHLEKSYEMETNIIVEDVYTFVNVDELKDEYESDSNIIEEEENIETESENDSVYRRKRWIKYDGMSVEDNEID